ncbi:hypothetical protein [Nesterenkonia pannonica]|uniref:hypothetical protein n=1 Tax=Nesterenkonia pannonica TaxID=1548602 RepID=UPI002164D7C7|nr:hypothetical protein [Nesterenkonia pannonica]
MGRWSDGGLFRLDESLNRGLSEIAAEQLQDSERVRTHRITAAWMYERGRIEGHSCTPNARRTGGSSDASCWSA